MRDQPQAWQYQSNDATESATGVVPSPREPADDTDAADSAARADSETRTANAEGTPNADGTTGDWAPPRSAATDGDDEPNLDAGDIDEAEVDRPVDETESDADRRDGTFADTSAGADESAEADDEADEAGTDEPAVGVAHVPDPLTGDGDGPDRVDGVATDRPTGETWTDRSIDEAPADEAADEAPADELAGDDLAGDERTADETAAADLPAGTTATDEAAVDSAADGAAAGDRPFDQEAAGGTAATQANGGELMPGDVPEQPMGALFDATAADDFRDRWQRLQMRFVDDPRGAADEARALTDDIVSALRDALDERRSSLSGWQAARTGDTEELRVAVRRYRDLLDRLLGL
jgi:hypothetical protein